MQFLKLMFLKMENMSITKVLTVVKSSKGECQIVKCIILKFVI